MIEVEKKFALSEEDAKRLLNGATFLKEVTMVDSYYDVVERTLSFKDWWLRERNGNFELKIASYEGDWRKQVVNQYRELETDPEIAQALQIPLVGSLRDALKTAGYEPFATITTVRRKYQKDGFMIDMDSMDFGYTISEIELMVDDPSQMPAAVEKIMSFAKAHGLSVDSVPGKLLEYLRRYDPPFFKRLIEAGAH